MAWKSKIFPLKYKNTYTKDKNIYTKLKIT